MNPANLLGREEFFDQLIHSQWMWHQIWRAGKASLKFRVRLVGLASASQREWQLATSRDGSCVPVSNTDLATADDTTHTDRWLLSISVAKDYCLSVRSIRHGCGVVTETWPTPALQEGGKMCPLGAVMRGCCQRAAFTCCPSSTGRLCRANEMRAVKLLQRAGNKATLMLQNTTDSES